MTKTQFKTDVYDLLKVLKDDGISVQGTLSDIKSTTPLVAYSVVDTTTNIHQNHIDRFKTWVLTIQVYGKNSVECSEIIDSIDSILLPVGFIENGFSDGYDKNSKQYLITCFYTIKIDEDGISYNIV